ncbi:MAG: AMP-binding protein [Pirellulales bacterium]|nr:AMP-binding protein [Pirellulales bacterium]
MFRGDDGSETSLTFAELFERAKAIAATLQRRIQPGDRVLLVYPAGLEFIAAFLGCVSAGVLPVPATYPKPRRPLPRLSTIAADCQAVFALTAAQTLTTLDLARSAPELRSVQWLATDTLDLACAADWQRPEVRPEDLAFLQYTSGSISDPKGVMVTHANLMRNLEMIYEGFSIPRICADPVEGTGVSWLPAYHDMGLIGGILEPFYVGGRSVLMSPAAFLQRPVRWLKAISDYRAVIGGAPNFAYELCVEKITPEQRSELDLGSWRLAFCGAEPIRPETLERFAETFAPCGFREDAFYPCYGLAESTLLAAGGKGPGRPVIRAFERAALAELRIAEANGHPAGEIHRVTGCGGPRLDQVVEIVDPETLLPVQPDRVGEIWIKGSAVARGYWNRAEENAVTFGGRLAGSNDGTYLRTGDLGFLRDGNLFVVARLKEVIVIRGRNHYPHDIELTVSRAHEALIPNAGATFSIDHENTERLVVVNEVDRQYRNGDLEQVVQRIRAAVAEEHELDVFAVVLIRPASLPRTTSGKVQRNLCRQQYLDGDLKVQAQWQAPSRGSNGSASGNGAARRRAPAERPRKAASSILPKIGPFDRPLREDEVERLAEQIETRLLDWLVERAGLRTSDFDRDKPFAEYGLDSLTAVELSHELEEWLDVEITPVVAWNYPTAASLAAYLAREVAGKVSPEDAGEETQQPPTAESEFEKLLAEIENLSDNDVEAALEREPRNP